MSQKDEDDIIFYSKECACKCNFLYNITTVREDVYGANISTYIALRAAQLKIDYFS